METNMKKILFFLMIFGTTIYTLCMEEMPVNLSSNDADQTTFLGSAIQHLDENDFVISAMHENRKRRFDEFECDHPGCSKLFADKNALKYHKKTHIPWEQRDLNFVCSECDYKTDQKSHLTRHQLTHIQDSGIVVSLVSCDIQGCSYTTYNPYNLATHKRRCDHSVRKSPADILREFPCDHPGCSQVFIYKSVLKHHKKTHIPFAQRDLNFVCPECGYKTDNKNHLKRHLITHAQDSGMVV